MKTYSEHIRQYRYGPVWKEVLLRDNFSCVLCNSRIDVTIDHIIPVSKGGKSILENLRILCRKCNTIEGHKKRVLNPLLEKERNRIRKFADENVGYFTLKSREFRAKHKGYYRLINQKQNKLYQIAKS